MTNTAEVLAAWGVGANDVWAVGTAGAMAHWNGVGWAAVTQNITTANLIAVSGTSSSFVEAITPFGVLHFDGTAWVAAPNPASTRLTGLWFDSRGVRWLSSGLDVYRKDALGESRVPSASASITKLKGWSDEIRVMSGEKILRHEL